MKLFVFLKIVAKRIISIVKVSVQIALDKGDHEYTAVRICRDEKGRFKRD